MMASTKRHSNMITPSMVGLNDNVSLTNLKASITEACCSWFIVNKGIHMERWDAHFPCSDRSTTDLLEVSFLEDEIR